MSKKPVIRNTVVLMLLVLTIILLPFVFFHDYIDGWTANALKASGQRPWFIALLIMILLASDILLPVPSSIVSIAAGFLLGFTNGMIVSFLGMTLGCVIGYGLGKGSAKTMKWLDAESRMRMEQFFQRYGKWAIIMARPVPVLAEASTFFAGISRMTLSSFLFVSALSNLGISLVYAAVGAWSFSVNSILFAFTAAVIIPGIGLLAENIYRNHGSRLEGGRKPG